MNLIAHTIWSFSFRDQQYMIICVSPFALTNLSGLCHPLVESDAFIYFALIKIGVSFFGGV